MDGEEASRAFFEGMTYYAGESLLTESVLRFFCYFLLLIFYDIGSICPGVGIHSLTGSRVVSVARSSL